MCCCNNEKNYCCCILTLLSAILGAVGIAAVFFTGLIPSVLALIIITLILGGIELIYLIFTAICNKRNCNLIKKNCLIPISVGAIVTSAFALSLTSLATFSIAVAILIGVIAFFLILSLISFLTVLFESFCKNICKD